MTTFLKLLRKYIYLVGGTLVITAILAATNVPLLIAILFYSVGFCVGEFMERFF